MNIPGEKYSRQGSREGKGPEWVNAWLTTKSQGGQRVQDRTPQKRSATWQQ